MGLIGVGSTNVGYLTGGGVQMAPRDSHCSSGLEMPFFAISKKDTIFNAFLFLAFPAKRSQECFRAFH